MQGLPVIKKGSPCQSTSAIGLPRDLSKRYRLTDYEVSGIVGRGLVSEGERSAAARKRRLVEESLDGISGQRLRDQSTVQFALSPNSTRFGSYGFADLDSR